MRANRSLLLVTLIILMAAPASAGAAPQDSSKPEAAQPAAKGKASKVRDASTGYVGSEACAPCHAEIHEAFFKKNAHKIVDTDKRRGWEKNACESCHGPGAKHAESVQASDILNPAKQAGEAADTSCLACHRNQATQVGRIHGGHARSQVACFLCHPIHNVDLKVKLESVESKFRLDSAQTRNVKTPAPAHLTRTRNDVINSQCAACHANVMAQFNRPHGHPISQGAMSCLDCHNPHASPLPKAMLRTTARTASNEPACINCHADKRGPFLFEHAPMRLEGCGSCHEPHGSANPRMMTRSEVLNLCLECHSNIANPNRPPSTIGGIAPAIHNLTQRRWQQCTTCHVKIHGSHANREFFR
jgi:predicted CXXCH cytochrome family protein